MAANLRVGDTTVPGVLDSLRKGEWLIPQFQRDFVWGTEQVSELVRSILASRPIGMITLWEQKSETPMKLERLSLYDAGLISSKPELRYFPEDEVKATKTFAVLDGKQRSTAIAMAFGGFRARNGKYRYSGRYYLDVITDDPAKRVRFIKEATVKEQGLDSDTTCIGRGLFPLASNEEGEEILKQWMRYLRLLSNKDCYANGELPEAQDLERRTRILEACFEGIVNTKLAVYTVPDVYNLTDICEIFDTLNTTGTKVSTVDLIHSLLYSETFEDPQGPFLLRDWMKDFGQLDGAYGWSKPTERPELVTQLVTATYVALEQKPAPRNVGNKEVSSVKAGDMLAVPAEYWRAIEQESGTLAQYLGDAQKVVAGGYFPWTSCPYPAAIGIYLALRWHSKFDFPSAAPWSRDEADALFRAFFWRNSLARRYDQGFLSQIGTDIVSLKRILAARPGFQSSSDWASHASHEIDVLFQRGFNVVPSREEIVDFVLDGSIGGALWKAISLPMLAGVERDLVSGVSLTYPNDHQVEMHHIFPKAWCDNNKKTDGLAKVLDKRLSGRDYVNSLANLMPLSRKSNNDWKQKHPAQFIKQKGLSYGQMADTFAKLFITEPGFIQLASGGDHVMDFWQTRADAIASDLLARTQVRL